MNKTIDIIMLSSFDKNAGGRETWLYNFLPEVLKREFIGRINLFGFKTPEQGNHKKSILALNDGKKSFQKLTTTIFEKKPSRLPMVFSMYKMLKKHKKNNPESPNFVMAMGILELFMVLRLKPYKKVKKIVFLRSIFSHEKAYRIPNVLSQFFLTLELKMLKKVDIVLGNGEDIEQFYSQFGVDVNVIKNGVDMQKWNLPQVTLNDPIHIAYIGRLSYVKGVEDYFKLVKRVKNGVQADNFVFHTVGNSYSYEQEVEEFVEQNFLIHHGIIPNNHLPEFLKKIDICVALTYASNKGGGGGTSNAMMEQMAAGRIILAWNNRIFDQYLNSENAYLAEQKNVKNLENNVYAILNNKVLAIEKSQKAIVSIMPYSYTLHVDKFEQMIATL